MRRTNSYNNYSNFRTHEYAYARGFESEFTAEELFNMFFGGGFPQQATQARYRRYQHHHEAQSVSFFIHFVDISLSRECVYNN